MGAGHVLGIGAVTPAAVAAGMRGHAPAAVEHLDRVGADADVNLLADQAVRHRIEEAVDLDVIVGPHAGQPPLGIDVWHRRQLMQSRSLDRLEQLAPTDAKAAHRALVHPAQRRCDRGVAFGEREEGEVAQPAENIGLGEANPGFDPGFRRGRLLALSRGLPGRAGEMPSS
jgi:hypothetical protein